MSSSKFDFSTFYRINSQIVIGTYSRANSWFQIELTKGSAVLHGFRLKRNDKFKLRSYKLICSDDASKPVEEWTTLIEINEETKNEHELLDIYKFVQPSQPTKYVRLIQTGAAWNNELNLAFDHLDLFGDYIP